MNKNPKLNASGYPDPTAYAGMQPLIKEEAAIQGKVNKVIMVFKLVADLAGFEIINRIHIRHKKSGKEFR